MTTSEKLEKLLAIAQSDRELKKGSLQLESRIILLRIFARLRQIWD